MNIEVNRKLMKSYHNENQPMLRLEIITLLRSFVVNFDEQIQIVSIMFVSIAKILQLFL